MTCPGLKPCYSTNVWHNSDYNLFPLLFIYYWTFFFHVWGTVNWIPYIVSLCCLIYVVWTTTDYANFVSVVQSCRSCQFCWMECLIQWLMKKTTSSHTYTRTHARTLPFSIFNYETTALYWSSFVENNIVALLSFINYSSYLISVLLLRIMNIFVNSIRKR
jgi:hypothetical protein